MARRAAKLKEIREEGQPMLLIEGGEFSPEYSRQGEFKFETILDSLRMMGYDAVNVGLCEMAMQRSSYDALAAIRSVGLPIVTLNVSYCGKRLRHMPVILERGGVRVAVFGLLLDRERLDAASGDWAWEEPEPIMAQALDYAETRSDFVIVALGCGDMDRIQRFVQKHPGADVVVLSQSPGDRRGFLRVGNSLLLCAGIMGRYLGRVDAFERDGQWHFDPEFYLLTRHVPEDPEMAGLYAAYQERVREMARAHAETQQRRLKDKFPPVTLAGDCKDCHVEAYEGWIPTRHADAMQTLVDVNEEYNPECVGCHSTAYLKGGFISMDTTPAYADVQCASCHGSLKDHIDYHLGISDENPDAALPPEVPRKVCIGCHNAERDPDFDFLRDRQEVH